MAAINNYLKKFNEAIVYANKSLQLAKEIESLEDEEAAHMNLSESYKGLGKYKEALDHFGLYKTLNDSIFNTEKHNQIAKMEAIFQSEKKQKEIELLNKDKEKQVAVSAAESKKQKTIIYSVVSILLLVLSFAIFAYHSYLQKRKANILLAQQKIEIEEKNEELNQQNEEIATQRDTVIKQKEHIEEIHREVTDSIQYAKRIQTAVLPSLEYISVTLNLKSLLEYFILFKPRDIVSGDFYFFERRKNILLIAVADCTGHGVPGAFMSMLGFSFLQEIISKEEIQSAAHVLNELRDYVIKSLQQKGMTGEQKDGMDIIFVALNIETNIIQFAGANNPLWLISNTTKELTELKPDKMPVAIYEKMNPFTNHSIQLHQGDIIYLVSDGYEDQFGGPKGKKFLTKNLKQLLSANSEKLMSEQKEILNNTIEDWKNNYTEKCEQTDDITIVGIKII